MTQENRLLEVLTKQYRKVIEEQLKTEDALTAKYQLFEKNLEGIDVSLTNKIDSFNEQVADIKVLFKRVLNDLKKQHKQQLEKLITEREKASDIFENDVKEIDETLDKKRSLNVLKEEKIETEYQLSLTKIEDLYKEQRDTLVKTMDEASVTYSSNIEQLDKETEIKLATQENLHDQRNIQLSNTIDAIRAQSEKEIADIKGKLSAYEKTFAKAIKDAKTAYLDALKPVDEERLQLDKNHEQDLKDINAHYESELGKKSKYQKEKEKIGDHAAASQYGKEIKKMNKSFKDTLERKNEQYDQAKIPLKKQKDAIKDDHQNKLYTIKKQGLEKIQIFLNSLVVQKTDELININNVNIEMLEQVARHDHKKTSINIDHDIQHLNFDQTLEEARLYHNFHVNALKPKESLEQEEKKRQYNEEKNELTKNRNTAKQLHKKDMQIRELKNYLNAEQLSYEQKRHEATHDFELKNARINHNIELINKDLERESLLSTHYYTHAKNYTALKNEAILAHKPAMSKEIENRKILQIKTYKDMIKQAEKDHKIIMAKINDTYEQEIIIYESAYIDIEKEHQETIQNLMTEQAMERNRDLEAIAVLDAKKDKALIKKYRKNLALKQSNHDEALAIKKRELESKLAIYKKMIEQIKSFKLHSLEEADTLLMHIKDQLNLAIENTEKASEQALSRFDKLYYEIKHSADLFETFQRQRDEDTVHAAKTYLKTRIDKEENTRLKFKTLFNETLEMHKDNHKAFEADNKSKQNEALDDYKKSLEAIEKTKEENLKNMLDATQNEKRRLETLLQKLQRSYETDLKNLSQTKEQEKQASFDHKDTADKKLKDILATRQKEAETYKAERESIKQNDLTRYRQNENAILAILEKNAIDLLTESDVKHLKAMIEGSQEVQFNK